MKFFRMIGRTALLTFFVLLMSACGGGNTTWGEVRYEGETLVVDGVSYPRKPDTQTYPSDYDKGRLYVLQWPVDVPEPESKLAKLGLTSKWSGAEAEVYVPVAWEEQWVRALRDLFKGISVDRICILVSDASYSYVNAAGEYVVAQSACR